ncbi:Fc.00g016560.m01.CDS01 [Cosmosporella sp. VM-42]
MVKGKKIAFLDAFAIWATEPRRKANPKKSQRATKSKKPSKKLPKTRMAKEGDKKVDTSSKNDKPSKPEKSPKVESPKSRDQSKSSGTSKTVPRPATAENHKSDRDSPKHSIDKGKEKAKEAMSKEPSPGNPTRESRSTANPNSQVPTAYPWGGQWHPDYVYPQGYQGNAPHPPYFANHFPPQPAPQNQMQPIPLGERPPASGYELLAETLTNKNEQRVKPIYRRFAVLYHRTLLHLQDRLCEQEEELNKIDAQDTQNRSYPGGIGPASRRHDVNATGDLCIRRDTLLSRIKVDLMAYNQLLGSFKEARGLPAPAENEIREYITYLATKRPIVPRETTFLDKGGDLILLTSKSGPPKAKTEDSLPKFATVFATIFVSILILSIIPSLAARLTLAAVFLGYKLSTLLPSGVVEKLTEARK